ncbi:gliding motility protein GldM [Aequorivita marina]|uniref:type IX secretion system motor protein PorM/GldM n=1 Tax=Aequorivita marina TaxID=3073654 RepID=UPI0028750C33|nr:gliding motility protein GldM [Aequorivita sp. S2608]MDS1298492.1 gliding motility protein GldM [Aequorivita sp. S2608]
MAGGKLSPRQRMINMMYLIFIAMMALNMSKEVLSAFGLLNERLTESNTAAEARNMAFMENLATKAAEQPEQYSSVKTKADEINAISGEFDAYLAGLKTDMMSKIDSEDTQNYEVQDRSDHLDQKLFNGDKFTKAGQEFLNQINKYRDGVIAVMGDDPRYQSIVADVSKKFETDPVKRNDGVTVPWLNYHFEGFPMVASRTKLTQMQSDIKTTENEILSNMLAGQQAAALSFTQYNTLLESSKSAYYAGEEFDGGIVLGRKDPNTKPNDVKLTLDGTPLSEDQYEVVGGKVMLKIGAGSPGDHKIEGNLIFTEDGEDTEVPVNLSFSTISKPNSAVIAADKMNVVYRGVDNPMTVSIPGIPDSKVSASAKGLSKVSGSKYMMRPGAGRTVTITASGTLPDGTGIRTPAEFRIKDIPSPVGTIRGEDGNGGPVRMERGGLAISSVGAALQDFDFALKLNVTGFSFKVSGQPTVRVNGNKLNGAAKSALKRAGRGETVQIFDIKTSISGSSVKLKRTSPVFIELTN